MEYLLKVISNRLSIKVEKVFDWGLRGVMRVDGIDFAELAKVLKSVACVSMAYLIHSYVRPSHFELIAEEVIKLVEHVFKGAEVFIDVRRWYKSYPLTSIEIAKAIAKAITEKGLAIPNPRAENTVSIGVDKGFTVVGFPRGNHLRIAVISCEYFVFASGFPALGRVLIPSFAGLSGLNLTREPLIRFNFFKPLNAIFQDAITSLDVTTPPSSTYL
jgi:hypothetical protein